MNAKCEMMNERQAVFNSSLIIPRSSFDFVHGEFMKRLFLNLSIALLFLTVVLAPCASAQKKPQGQKPSAQAKPKATPATAKSDDALKAELDEIVKLTPAERVKRLEEFIKS